MAKIHDLFIIELAEVIKGYGNDPDVEDPFRMSEFYRFYELPNIAVSRENFEKMRPAQPEQRWIPCSERLPKPIAPSQKREWFITSNQYGGVTLTCYEFEASPFKEGWQTDMTILAWMPLPEPWRGEGDE